VTAWNHNRLRRDMMGCIDGENRNEVNHYLAIQYVGVRWYSSQPLQQYHNVTDDDDKMN
jgi:carboxylesterase type B